MRFIHTSDWQLGLTRHFFDDDAQPRFSDARFDAIKRIGAIAEERDCSFVVVAGDVFETNYVDRRTVVRALEAMAEIQIPVYLLPGNHDPLDAGSVYRSRHFEQRRPPNVHLLEGSVPVEAAAGAEIVAAVWTSKQAIVDLAAEAVAPLGAAPPGVVRILVAHGIVESLAIDRSDPATIRGGALEAALADGRIGYAALGDRHSVEPVGSSGRIWYSGSPEPTDYDEIGPGQVLVVDVGDGECRVERVETGTWRFEREKFEFASDASIRSLSDWLDGLHDKRRTVVKLDLVGTVSVRGRAEIDSIVDSARDAFAAVEISTSRTDLATMPADEVFSELGLSGFAEETVKQLEAAAIAGGEAGSVASDALALLYRLARGAE